MDVPKSHEMQQLQGNLLHQTGEQENEKNQNLLQRIASKMVTVWLFFKQATNR